MFSNMKTILTLPELAAFLKVSTSTIKKMQGEGLPYLKVLNILRFDQEEVLAWLAHPKPSCQPAPVPSPGTITPWTWKKPR